MKTITLESIAPSASIEKTYREAMYAMLAEMRQDIIKNIVRPYRQELAMDSIVDWLGHVIDSLVTKWQNRLNKLPQQIAEDMVGTSKANYEKRLARMLKRRGFTVQFKNSQAVEDAVQIAIGENVSLIKSVGNQYLDNVRSAVWRSVKDGYDAESLIKQLRHIDGVSERRAKNIAKDQIAKANAAFEKERALELGIKEAIWVHSSAGKTPRPSHVKANGTRYEIEKGCYIDNEWIQPAFKINCRCRAKLIIEIPDNIVDTNLGIQ